MPRTDYPEGPCYEIGSSNRLPACPSEGIEAGNCPGGTHYHGAVRACWPNSERPEEGCWDGSGNRRIACPSGIPPHTYRGREVTDVLAKLGKKERKAKEKELEGGDEAQRGKNQIELSKK